VENENASILVALGTHREMTQEEKEKKFGRTICEALSIHMHHWDREDELCDLGTTEGGTQILLNKRVMEADLVIGVGQIVPHRVAGYSGGCKIIQPGVCGAVTTGQTHWLSAKFTGEEIMGKIDNPVREEMNRVGLRANLKFIVNAVMDLSDEIVDAVCGDPIAAFQKGARLSGEIFGVEVPEKADIVLTDSYPADLEMWQASKGIYAADLAVKEGGVIVMISPCYEGVCAEHPDILRYGYLPYDAVQKLVDSSEIKDLTLAAHLIHMGRVIKEKATGILVSSGIEPAQAETLGFMTAETPQKGLDLAFKIAGSNASVNVLQHAGHILPLIR
jgi:nickel-dependent lactate racemase